MSKRWFVPVVLSASALFSACGNSSTATTSSVLNLESTNWATLAPTPSTVPVTSVPGPGQPTPEPTQYTVQKGDVPYTVARKYGITIDALILANANTPGYGAFYEGLKIVIPAGATVPQSTLVPSTSLPVTPSETTTTLAGGGSNCVAGKYKILDGDLPSTVAGKFDVTVAQLDAANVGTKGYKNFIVGVEIVIPKSSAPGCP
jgi:LysM repeat protein